MTEHVLGRLSAYIDGELPEAERLELAAHLRECPECEALRRELLRTDQAAREAELAPAGYFDSLPGRIRERVSGTGTGRASLPVAAAPPAQAAAPIPPAPAAIPEGPPVGPGSAELRAPVARRTAVPAETGDPRAEAAVGSRPPASDRETELRGSVSGLRQSTTGSPVVAAASGPAQATVPGRTPRARVPVWGWAAAAGLLIALATPLLLRERPSPAPAAETGALPAAPGRGPAAAQFQPAPQATALPPAQAAERSQSQLADVPARQEAHGAASGGVAPGAAPAAPPAAPPAPVADLLEGGQAVSNETATPKRLAGQAAVPPTAPATRAKEDASLRKAEADAETAFVAAPAPAGAPPAGTVALGAAARKPVEAKDSVTGDGDYGRLLARTAGTAEQARTLRGEWQALVPRLGGAQADEARVRVIESGALAYRLGREARDAQAARADAAAYLARPDAAQAARVRAALASLDR